MSIKRDTKWPRITDRAIMSACTKVCVPRWWGVKIARTKQRGRI